ncbi:hypothetical protein IQ22_01156 [Pseudomonas duriflava]|uniref:Uncharacterized protein n=1 Tax=Pseudomonas duriflava TaxID=459528 RepID=A0A562QIZ0_9PSED|nr:hypothetical protein IQ22_01156 [Pseudomonas duriflava]
MHDGYQLVNARYPWSALTLFRHFQGAIYLNSWVLNCALELRIAEQALNCPQVLYPAIDPGCFRAAHRVGAVYGPIETTGFSRP